MAMAEDIRRETPEQRVGRCLAEGITAVFRHDEPRTLSAGFVRKLLLACVRSAASVAPVGIAIHGAQIEGDLRCIAFGSPSSPLPPLDLTGCELTGELDLTDASFSSVTLNGCRLRALKAPWLRIDNAFRADNLTFVAQRSVVVDLEGLACGGAVTLQNLGRSPAHLPYCELHLKQVRIVGELDCSGSRLWKIPPLVGRAAGSEETYALSMDGADIGGDVLLDSSDQHRFEVFGGANLSGGKIGGQLSCVDALFVNRGTAAPFENRKEKNALVMDRLRVTNSVFLKSERRRFEAQGEIRLIGATIGGQLSCEGALLCNPGGDALSMDRASIAGTVFLRSTPEHRFEAYGSTRLSGTKIGGQLTCSGATFIAPHGSALTLRGGEVSGDVAFSGLWIGEVLKWPFRAEGTINLRSAVLSNSLSCRGEFTADEVIFDFDNLSVDHDFNVKLGPNSRGEVWMRGARLGDLNDNGGQGWGAKPDHCAGTRAWDGVRLKISGMSYDGLGKWEEPDIPKGWWRQMGWRVRRSLGLGVPQDIWWNRARWLERQYVGLKPQREDFFPQPHEQLAKVLRLVGHDYHSRRIMAHKFVHESQCRVKSWWSRLFQTLYSLGFGCGYIPGRALLTVAIWWTFGALLTWGALHANTASDAIFVRSAAGVEIVRTLSKPDEAPVKARKEPYEAFKPRDVPCTSDDINPILYALDTMLPVFQLHMENKCEFNGEAFSRGDLARLGKALYSLIGWIIVTLAALTWTGVLRREPS